MIIGSGLLANAFYEYKDIDNILIFASGVSNSKEILEEEFLREEQLLNLYLEKYGDSKHFVYFSTCSIFDTYFERSAYTKHKLNMEKIITKKAFSYNIFRLSQVLGKNNKKQLIGFLFDVIKNEKYFDLYNIERNIIDIDDILYFTKKIINLRKSENSIINIANPINIKVFDLVKLIEKITNKKAKYNLIEKKGSFVIDNNYIKSFEDTNQIFKENYLENRIKKYYE